ncbi:MAG: peptidoglycan editing factor PgeF [Patescibacteria group bacterium]
MAQMFEIFERYSNLLVAFSEKKDGNLKLGNNLKETAKENREKFFRKLELKPEDVVSGGLVQGNRIAVVKEKDRGKIVLKTDGLITATKEIFLSVTAADCLPVFFYDPTSKVIAIAHAGWRGLAKDILQKVVRRMQREFQCRPMDILVGLGPAIGECHYDVQEDVAQEFKDFSSALLRRQEKTFLDLKKIAALELQSVGVFGKNIEIHPACTSCLKETYFSYRRDKPEKVQAMLALIGFK